MAKSEYAKYFQPAPIKQSIFKQITQPQLLASGKDVFGGANFTMCWVLFTEPFVFVEDAHAHKYEQFFCLLGGNPMNINEFEAEIWFYLGREKEKFVITSPTMIHVPSGILHCPLIIKSVTKPVMYMDFPISPSFDKRPIPLKSQR
jgi:hypothetical protein